VDAVKFIGAAKLCDPWIFMSYSKSVMIAKFHEYFYIACFYAKCMRNYTSYWQGNLPSIYDALRHRDI